MSPRTIGIATQRQVRRERRGPAKAPWQLKVAVNIPGVNDLLGRVVGNGFRPEHIAGARCRAASNAVCLKKVAVGIGLVAASAMLAFHMFRSMKRRESLLEW
ncbi:MAG TPA: hypothetical protein VII95_05400 [Terriglobales bacterium]|jgi:hypothetical protein